MSAIPVDPRSKAQGLKAVLANIQKWRACAGCDGLIGPHIAICPACASYRFDRDPKAVRRAARKYFAPRTGRLD
jgi:hypothetical protein